MLKAQFQLDQEREKRRAKFTRSYDEQKVSTGYSMFVRWMRILLPVTALIIIGVLFTMTGGREKDIIPTQEEAKVAPSVGKNELLNPHFESVDKNNQPYEITADRAVQGSQVEQMVLLINPKGNMTMSSGEKAYMEAKNGAFRQDNNRVVLEGAVKLTHQNGYVLNTEKLNIDLNNSLAWTEVDVQINGPDGSIDARGMKANDTTGLLEFTGPAKMIINNGALQGFNVGGI